MTNKLKTPSPDEIINGTAPTSLDFSMQIPVVFN